MLCQNGVAVGRRFSGLFRCFAFFWLGRFNLQRVRHHPRDHPHVPADLQIIPAVSEQVRYKGRQLDRFRLREGAAIETEVRLRAASLRDLVQRMEAIRTRALPHFQQRLRDKLSELLGGAQIEPARIAQEAAILAERSDISEELVRLKTHADQTDALLSAEGETGKKLDFLLQEMNREANTILSKTGGLGEPGLTLTDLGLAAKAEIDRIREQSLNIE